MLAPGGARVPFRVSESAAATLHSRDFIAIGGAWLYRLILFHELRTGEPASAGLAVLARLDADHVLRPHIAIESPWTKLGPIARKLLDRVFAGKTVLQVSSRPRRFSLSP